MLGRLLILLALSVVAVSAFCGDGVVDEGEYCDSGSIPYTESCCTTDCRAPVINGDGASSNYTWLVYWACSSYPSNIYPTNVGFGISGYYIDNFIFSPDRVNVTVTYASDVSLDYAQSLFSISDDGDFFYSVVVANSTGLEGTITLEWTFITCPETSPASDLHATRNLTFQCCGDGMLYDTSDMPLVFAYYDDNSNYHQLNGHDIAEQCDLGTGVNGEDGEWCTAWCRIPTDIPPTGDVYEYLCSGVDGIDPILLPLAGYPHTYSAISIYNYSTDGEGIAAAFLPWFGLNVPPTTVSFYGVYQNLTVTFEFTTALSDITFYVQRTIYFPDCSPVSETCIPGTYAWDTDGNQLYDSCCSNTTTLIEDLGYGYNMELCAYPESAGVVRSFDLVTIFGEYVYSIMYGYTTNANNAYETIYDDDDSRWLVFDMPPADDEVWFLFYLLDCYEGQVPFILRIANIGPCCGDGVVNADAYEECDLGSEDNGSVGSCCNAQCQFNPVDAANGCARIENSTFTNVCDDVNACIATNETVIDCSCPNVTSIDGDLCEEVDACLTSPNGTMNVCEEVAACVNASNVSSTCDCPAFSSANANNEYMGIVAASVISSAVVAAVIAIILHHSMSPATLIQPSSPPASDIAPPTFIDSMIGRPFRFHAKHG